MEIIHVMCGTNEKSMTMVIDFYELITKNLPINTEVIRTREDEYEITLDENTFVEIEKRQRVCAQKDLNWMVMAFIGIEYIVTRCTTYKEAKEKKEEYDKGGWVTRIYFGFE